MRNVVRKPFESVNSDERKISSAAYDTAWVARVTDQGGKSLFPECIQWLLENQKPDGSWGGQILSYHDRIISTLSALVALKEIGRGRYNDYIQRGEKYIWENVKNLEHDHCRFISSELLFPSLMRQAASAGLNLPYHTKIYEREYQAKLSKVEKSQWYSPVTPLSYSLEFLGEEVDMRCLANVLLPNGSVAASPAATAFFLNHIKDERAFEYLKKVLTATGNGSVMTVYPIEVFEYSWTIYNLMLAGLYFDWYAEICNYFLNHMESSGFGWSTESPIHDADGTAMVLRVLYDMGFPVDVRILERYNTGDYYVTYGDELDFSISTNIHVLNFIGNCPVFSEKEEIIENLIQFLKREIHPAGFWIDKWHASAFYPTCHAVLALCEIEPSLAEKAVSWILKSQNENGTWGENNGTLEETAYTAQSLLCYHQEVEHINIDSISKALSCFGHDILPLLNTLPELWVGKVLYYPRNVVLSAILSASIMHNTAIWNLCSGWSI